MFHDHIRIPDLARSKFKADPDPLYARLRAEAPVYRTRFGSVAKISSRPNTL
jgi:hypothetical protein